jgi:RNA-binding protein YlmH
MSDLAEIREEAPSYAEMLVGTSDLNIPHWDHVEYDPELIHLALANDHNPELKEYKRKLQIFIEQNISEFTLQELAQILGVTVAVIIKLTPRNVLRRAGKRKTQTVVVWRTLDSLSSDQMKYNLKQI